jgi:hypothetical protein
VKHIRKRLTYANVMSSIAVFLILGGATAFAAKKIGAKQLKPNSVTTAKIKKNAVTTAKIKNNAVTGAKVNESTLSTVPSAASLVGQTTFDFRLGFGQSQTIASNGVVSLVAVCDQKEGLDRARILEQTSQDGAVASGDDFYDGQEGNFLNVNTPEEEREFGINTIASGITDVENDIDSGFVLGPDGRGLTTNSEGIALGLNYGAAGCLFAGVINTVG